MSLSQGPDQRNVRKYWCPFCIIALILITIYRILVSPIMRWRKVTCLHYPTCSHYGALAFSKYRFNTAFKMTYCRIRDCNPFSGRPYIDYP